MTGKIINLKTRAKTMEEMASFKDIIKKSALNADFASTLSVSDIGVSLLVTLAVGLFIFFIYKKTFQGVLYTQSFNVALVMISLVTALVIMTISSNLILSLGMVGALSIVRFRTAIKDPMDIVFMFWAIASGIANGAAYYKISITGSIFIAISLFILSRFKSQSSPYLLILNYNNSSDVSVDNYLKNNFKRLTLKSKTITKDNTELTTEIRLNKNNSDHINNLSNIDGVKNAVLVSYNGDYVS
jgi:uncharacterized membrane protein YhiD involved in acid resistance